MEWELENMNFDSLILIFVIGMLVSIIFLGITIWGIVAAACTQDISIRAGRLLLHFFLWGGIIAAIIYAVKANSNANKAMLASMQIMQQSLLQNASPKKED